MEQNLIDKDLGDKGELKLDLVDGQLKLSINYALPTLKGEVSVVLNSDELLDKLAELIPGKVDDAVINILKVALKS
jgi:hypothetical protein